MTEPDIKVAANASVPRATLMKRYKRLQIRGIALVACLVVVGLYALLVLSETYFNSLNRPRTFTKQERSARLTAVFVHAFIKLLQLCGLSIFAIRIAMVVIAVICAVAIVGTIVYVKRAAPPKAERLQKKQKGLVTQ